MSTDVLAFDTTNFDTHIATTTVGELARRGHAKSQRSDLRVVGLAALVSETGHVPLLHRTYPGNGSDQAVLGSCLDALGKLHDALNDVERDGHPACRTLVRDGGSWSEQLELDPDVEGYSTLISLPLSHGASELALAHAVRRGAMKRMGGELGDVRAARLRDRVGELDRTLVVVESQELLRGQKRGIAVALRREHLSRFVVATVKEHGGKASLNWHVDAARRRLPEHTRLGRRVLCTDRHIWSTGRIVHAFRGQWNVEELFRRAKKGGVVPWGPSHQWADGSLQLHTFATVIGLTLVSLAHAALGSGKSARSMMQTLAGIEATMVRVRTKERGRRATVLLAPELTAKQRKAVQVFDPGRWMPALLSSMTSSTSNPSVERVA